MVTVDFGKALKDAKSASFEALPIGDYDVEVAKADSVRASSGKPMIKVQMKVLAGPYQERQVFNNFVLSLENPQAMAIWFRHMRSFGLTDEFFAALGGNGSMEAVASALVTRRARLTLAHREWQGETRNEVTAVKPYTGAPGLPGPTGPTPAVGVPAGPQFAATAPPQPPPTPQLATPAAPATPPTPAYVAPPTPPVQPVAAAPQPPTVAWDGGVESVVAPTQEVNAVPTTAGVTPAASAPTPPTAPTSSDPQPQPPAAPELPF